MWEIGQAEEDNYELNVSIQYWTVVIPLTLLSCYLLLSKPRQKLIQPVHLANDHEKLAVEGYVLHDFKDGFVLNPPVGVAVFPVDVRKRTYHHSGRPMSIEQLAKLGSRTPLPECGRLNSLIEADCLNE